MNENLDLTKILKDCPKGTKFYSRCLGSVEFCKIPLDNYIEVINKNGRYIRFKPNGIYQYSEDDAEIDLFPSKDEHDWSKWQRPFVKGDVVSTACGSNVFIFDKPIHGDCGKCLIGYDFSKDSIFEKGSYVFNRLATEEEKQLLFDVIKKNGYEWNAETKTLEKLKKEKFDPKTLQPFDKVLVRDCDKGNWAHTTFGYIDKKSHYLFVCDRGLYWNQCIPYNEETKHLLGTSDKAPEKYINW